MRLHVEPNAPALAEHAARRLVAAVRARPDAVLGLATGRTMRPVYAALARRLREEGLSLAGVRAFALDEYVGVGRDDPRSFRTFLARHVLEATDLPAASLAVPDGLAADPEAEAGRYEAAVREAGGLDLQLLGIGRNGHLGFNEPGAPLGGPCHVQRLAEETLAANREALAAGEAPPPRAAITLGLGSILAARACLLVASGAAKAAAVAAAVEGPVTERVPASVLQRHPDATVLLDAAAAAGLRAPPS